MKPIQSKCCPIQLTIIINCGRPRARITQRNHHAMKKNGKIAEELKHTRTHSLEARMEERREKWRLNHLFCFASWNSHVLKSVDRMMCMRVRAARGSWKLLDADIHPLGGHINWNQSAMNSLSNEMIYLYCVAVCTRVFITFSMYFM